jgi:hypothetical protein
VAGDGIASRSALLSLGIKTPPEVDCTSSFAEASGLLVPMPTFWQKIYNGASRKKRIRNFIRRYF